MKVIILHQHFKTPGGGGAVRSYYLARALVERGADTIVITAHNGPAEKVEQIDGIKVHYLPVPYDNRFGFYRRIWSFYQFAVKAVRTASRYNGADICYAISTPLTTGMAARRIRKRYGIPYVFEVGDLWPDAPVQMGFVKNPLVTAALYRMERVIYRDSESIVALSGPIRESIAKKIHGKEIHVIPNMADIEFYKPAEKNEALVQKFGVNGRFVVSYIGALGVANGLHRFLDCAAESQRAGLAVHFVLCGDGAVADELKVYAHRLKLDNLAIIPFQNRDGVRDVLNVTDANFISYLPVRILETGSPNKYFDGLAAGKLTVVNFRGWIKEEIEQERCGVYVAHPGDFAEAIKPFLDDSVRLDTFQRAARRVAEQKYSRRELGEKYFKLLETIGK